MNLFTPSFCHKNDKYKKFKNDKTIKKEKTTKYSNSIQQRENKVPKDNPKHNKISLSNTS